MGQQGLSRPLRKARSALSCSNRAARRRTIGRDLWHYRELFAILAWRDVAVRYKQTVIGVAWAVVRPFLTMVVSRSFSAGWRSCRATAPRPIPFWSSPACCPGSCFPAFLSEASNSLIGNANLISQSLFPAPDRPAACGRRRACRFPHQSCHPRVHHGLVSASAGLADRVPAGLHCCSPFSPASARRCGSPRST